MPTRRIPPPYRGVSNATPYYETPGDLCPPGSMSNVRCFVPNEDRATIGQRPGLRRKFSARIGNGAAIQALRALTRASVVSGYSTGSCTAVTDNWQNKDGTSPVGQVWLLNQNLAPYGFYYENVAASGPYGDTHGTDPSEQSVACIACPPGGSYFVFGSTYDDGSGTDKARVTAINSATGALMWSHAIVRPVDTFVNAIEATNEFVFVATSQYVRVLRADTGELLTDRNLDRWSSEVIECRVTDDGDYLYATFLGSDVAATLASSQAVTAGKYAQYFRAGVMKWQINHGNTTTPLTRVTYGAGLASNNTYWEANHNYLRFSEVFASKPRGCYPTGLAVMPDGGCVVCHSNQGWGPTSSFTPDGAAFAPHTVTVLDDSGAIVWQADTDSFNTVAEGSVRNDIEFESSGAIFTSILAVTADALGNVYAAGRRAGPSTNYGSVFKLNAADGSIAWRFDCGHSSTQTVRQTGLFIDPLDGNLWVAGDRSNSWTGASTNYAHLWKLSVADGSVIGYYDLNTASISALGVCVDLNGQIAYCSDRIP